EDPGRDRRRSDQGAVDAPVAMKRGILLAVAATALSLLSGASGGTRPMRVLFVTDLLKPATKHDLRGDAYLGFSGSEGLQARWTGRADRSFSRRDPEARVVRPPGIRPHLHGHARPRDGRSRRAQ